MKIVPPRQNTYAQVASMTPSTDQASAVRDKAMPSFRMPLRAYRHDAGWLLGHTFMEFVHTGRKTGKRYETVAMVLRYDPDAHEAVICACWGPDTDWVRNLRAGPAARVWLGRESFPRSTGSCPMRRPSTSSSSSAASTRGGCG